MREGKVNIGVDGGARVAVSVQRGSSKQPPFEKFHNSSVCAVRTPAWR